MVPGEGRLGWRKFIGVFLDNILGNVIAAETTRLHRCCSNCQNWIDHKIEGYAGRIRELLRILNVEYKDITERIIPKSRTKTMGTKQEFLETARGKSYVARRRRIPYGNEILIVQGDKSDKKKKSTLSIISCVKAQKYMEKGCQLFLSQVTVKENKDESKEKRLEDVPTIRDFP
ncbi:hypothetical protein Tco_0149472 [Tanacetum coccineum]